MKIKLLLSLLFMGALLHAAEPPSTESIKVELTNLIQNNDTGLLMTLFYAAHGYPENKLITTPKGSRQLSETEIEFIKYNLNMRFDRPIDPDTGQRFFDFVTNFFLKSE
jgi:hypothetical protein